jgi:hypothetical protein
MKDQRKKEEVEEIITKVLSGTTLPESATKDIKSSLNYEEQKEFKVLLEDRLKDEEWSLKNSRAMDEYCIGDSDTFQKEMEVSRLKKFNKKIQSIKKSKVKKSI